MSDITYILIPLIIGLILAGSTFIVKRKELIAKEIEADGIIFGFAVSPDSNISARYPIVRFVTNAGLWITEPADIGLPSLLLKKGQQVKVIYNPKEFIYKTSIDFSKISYLMFGVGFVCFGAGSWFAHRYLTQ
jgi:hypothetical protein